MRLYLIAYDISHDGKRRRVARILEGYGARIQLSLFEAILSRRELRQLRIELSSVLGAEDACLIAALDERSGAGRWTWLEAAEDWNAVIQI